MNDFASLVGKERLDAFFDVLGFSGTDRFNHWGFPSIIVHPSGSTPMEFTLTDVGIELALWEIDGVDQDDCVLLHMEADACTAEEVPKVMGSLEAAAVAYHRCMNGRS